MVTKIIKEDFVAALTGGFYFDFSHGHLLNLIHIYTWVIFFISPLLSYLLAPASVTGGLIYCALVTTLVCCTKFALWVLHRIIDQKEPIVETQVRPDAAPSDQSPSAVKSGELASVDEDLEEKCRRIGLAGLDMADIFEGVQQNQTITPREPASLSLKSSANQPIVPSGSSTEETSAGIQQLPEPSQPHVSDKDEVVCEKLQEIVLEFPCATEISTESVNTTTLVVPTSVELHPQTVDDVSQLDTTPPSIEDITTQSIAHPVDVQQRNTNSRHRRRRPGSRSEVSDTMFGSLARSSRKRKLRSASQNRILVPSRISHSTGSQFLAVPRISTNSRSHWISPDVSSSSLQHPRPLARAILGRVHSQNRQWLVRRLFRHPARPRRRYPPREVIATSALPTSLGDGPPESEDPSEKSQQTDQDPLQFASSESSDVPRDPDPASPGTGVASTSTDSVVTNQSPALRLVRRPVIRRRVTPRTPGSTDVHVTSPIQAADSTVASTETTSPVSPQASSSHSPPTSAIKTVDTILAQLMGVPSLADAGLTREQCLSLLRASSDAKDSDDAELDILFAVSTATNLGDDGCPSNTDAQLDPSVLRPPQRPLSSIPENPIVTVTPASAPASADASPTHENSTEAISRSSLLPIMITQNSSQKSKERPRQAPPGLLYRVQPFPGIRWFVNLRLDRQRLDALFDRNQSIYETLLCILLAAYVSAVGYALLQTKSFPDFNLFLCCFTIAGCQYSLVKSVQPDAASPQHGFNRIIVFSRSALFCVLATLFLLTAPVQIDRDHLAVAHTQSLSARRVISVQFGQLSLIDRDQLFDSNSPLLPPSVSDFPLLPTPPIPSPPTHPSLSRSVGQNLTNSRACSITLFRIPCFVERCISFIHLSSFCLLLIFPFLFLFGLVPQVDTTLIYLLEQIDIHLFGASGAVSLLSVSFSILRNLFVIALGYLFGFNALQTGDPYHIRFSLFWSIYIPLCFLLSRLPSNTHLYVLILPTATQRAQVQSTLVSWFARFRHYCTHKSTKSKKRAGSKVHLTPAPHSLPRCTASPWWREWLPLMPDVSRKSIVRSKSLEPTERLLIPTLECTEGDVGQSTLDSQGDHSWFHMPPFSDRKYVSSPALLSEPCVETNEADAGVQHFGSLLHSFSPSTSQTAAAAAEELPGETHPNTPQTCSSLPSTSNAAAAAAVPLAQNDIDLLLTNSDAATQLAADSLSSPPGSDRVSAARSGSEFSEELGEEWVGKPTECSDPLPNQLRTAFLDRLENDIIRMLFMGAVVFGLHASPTLKLVCTEMIVQQFLLWSAILCGTFLHYMWAHLRKSFPWLLLARPAIPSHIKGDLNEWESGYFWLCWIERNLLLPTVLVIQVSRSVVDTLDKFGPHWATLIILIPSMKMLRNAFAPSTAGRPFLVFFFIELLSTWDAPHLSEVYPLNYLAVSILLTKAVELMHKLHFVYIYTSPFRIVWGSLTHCIGQIASIPHALLMLANCLLSTILSSPLEPFLASAIFITAHARPIKFWEVKHRTERMETTNTVLASQLRGATESQAMSNLNSIFYERLARNLQLSLAGDLYLGRLGGLSVNHGDVFILGSEDLNFLVHIIEVGNGIVTFQLRGLEFIGTYCHEQETEILRSSSHNDVGLCCCNPGHFPGMLSLNAALKMRCMTWQFITKVYNVDGYSMANPSADTAVRMHDLRRILVNRFVQCIIYFVLRLPDLSQRLDMLSPHLHANNFCSESHVDLDPVFLVMVDPDFDSQINGVTRRLFVQVYLEWIRFCLWKNPEYSGTIPCEPHSPIVSLCYALSLLGRRCVGGSQTENYDINQVLRGVHDVFKGDVHVINKDDWVLVDLDLLQSVITPAMRIALKLYQDFFLWASRMTLSSLYKKIVHTENNFVICHETDPMWRLSVLNDAHHLFSLRWVGGGADDTYRFIHLTKSKLQFYAVKINEECVRGLWSGQQREQIYIRSTDQERGSIQGAQHVLRNLVNSSCDPPIGYPIYVSPLLTSFVGNHPQVSKIGGCELSFRKLLNCFISVVRNLRSRCCRKSPSDCDANNIELRPSVPNLDRSRLSKPHFLTGHSDPRTPFLTTPQYVRQASVIDSVDSVYSRRSRHRILTTLSALVHEHVVSPGDPTSVQLNRPLLARFQIADPNQILDDLLSKLSWPFEEWRVRCLPRSVCLSSVYTGLEGERIHRWTPNNPDPAARSFCHRTIALLGFPGGPPFLDGHYVAIWEDKGLMSQSSGVAYKSRTDPGSRAPTGQDLSFPFQSSSLTSLS